MSRPTVAVKEYAIDRHPRFVNPAISVTQTDLNQLSPPKRLKSIYL